MSWDDIAARHGTDKATVHPSGKGHGYMPTYERWLYGRDVRRVLEIGILDGASLRTWAEVFPDAIVVGVDIHAMYLDVDAERVVTVLADAADRDAMTAVAEEHGPFDLIVDDGSHREDEIVPALDALWTHVAPGGLYVVEDLYWRQVPCLLASEARPTIARVAADVRGDQALIGLGF